MCACFSFCAYSGEGTIFPLTRPYNGLLATMNSKAHSAMPQKVLQAIIFVLGPPSISWGITWFHSIYLVPLGIVMEGSLRYFKQLDPNLKSEIPPDLWWKFENTFMNRHFQLSQQGSCFQRMSKVVISTAIVKPEM